MSDAIYAYAKRNYYNVAVRFPKAWEEAIREMSGDSVNRFIVEAVGEKIGREYNPIDLIARKKREKAEREG